MARSRRLVQVGWLVFATFAATSWWTRAQQSPDPDSLARDASAVITDDLVTAGESVQVDADVRGDVAAAGAEVSIGGPVQGYVMGAGRHVRIGGPVGNDVWAAGETVEIDDTIGNNAMVAGRLVRLRTGAVVGEDARLRVEPGAVIGGDLVVVSPRPPDISPGAQVSGEVRYEAARRRWSAAWAALWAVVFGALLVLGLAATFVAPARARHVSDTLRSRPGASLVAGALALVLIPIGIVALAVTVVGIPLAAVMVAIYVLLLLLSGVFVSYGVGGWLLERAHRETASAWSRVILGALVVSLAIAVPMVGWVLALAVIVLGTGALVLDREAVS